MRHKRPRIGDRVGRLIIIKSAISSNYQKRWFCRCDCGSTKIIRDDALASKRVRSCGCYRREMVGNASRTHGRSRSSVYRSWIAMRSRCNNPSHAFYKNYGGRGIQVCKRWLGEGGFSRFLRDMGEKPMGKSLDRINNNRGYSPSNCRWATQKQQMNNMRGNVIVEVKGEKMTLAECCERLGIKRSTLQNKLTKNEHYKVGELT